MKHLKEKFGKKVLAVLAALAVIVCSVPVTMSALADTQIYTVAASSPAIPVTVLTTVPLSGIKIEVDGTPVSATEFQWKSGNEAVTIENGSIVATKKGTFPVTASKDGNTITLYVVSKASSDTEWVLYEETFNDGKVPDNWNVQIYNSNPKAWKDVDKEVTYTDSSVASIKGVIPYYHTTTGANVWTTNGVMYLKNDILNAFGDYTVTVSMASYCHNIGGSGIIGRINDNGTKLDATSSFVGFYNDGSSSWGAKDRSIPYSMNYSNDTWGKTKIGEETAWSYGFQSYSLQNYSAKFDGTNGSYWSNDVASGDGSKDSPFTATITKGNGTVGIATMIIYDGGFSSFTKVQKVKVALNNTVDDCPAYQKLDTYVVEEGSPAIPMYALTKVNTKDFIVEFDGEYVFGNNVTFAPTEHYEGVRYDGSSFIAYSSGVYAFNAEYNGKTKLVYVVVKEDVNKSWYIYNKEFTENVIPEDWVSQWRQDGQYGKVNIYTWTDLTEATPYIFANGAQTVAPGVVPFPNTASWNAAGYFTLKDDVVNRFSDYTVTADVVGYSHYNYTESGFGIFGRANLSDDNKLSNNTTLSTLYYNSHANSKKVYQLESVPADQTTSTITRTEIGTDYTVTNSNSGSNSVTMSVKFEGNGLTFSEQSNGASVTTTTTNTQTGTIGIYCGMIGDDNQCSFVNVRKVSVALNNASDDCPAYSELNSYKVKYYDPVIVMNNMTKTSLDNMIIQLTDGGAYYSASQLNWSVAGNIDGLEVKNGYVYAYTNGTFPVTVSNGSTSKTLYFLVKNSESTEVTIMDETFDSHAIDYNVWNQVEYKFGNKSVVNTPADYAARGYSAPNGVIPFVGTEKWGDLEDGTYVGSAQWAKIFQNNVGYYLYLREDYVTDQGVKISDLGVYKVSVTASPVDVTTKVDWNRDGGNIRMEYNGIGILGRLNVNGETFAQNVSTYQMFEWDGQLRLSGNNVTTFAPVASGTYPNTSWSANLTADFGASSIVGTYRSSEPVSTLATPTNGTVGIYSKGREMDFTEFKIAYSAENTIDSTPITVSQENIKAAVNTRFALSCVSLNIENKEVVGSGVQWVNSVSNVGEVFNNTFIAYNAGTTTVTARYNGQDIKVNITVVSDAASVTVPYSESFAGSNITVKPNTQKGEGNYTVTVNNTTGEVLSDYVISVTDNGQTSTYSSVDNADTVFEIQVLNPATFVITADTTADDSIYAKPLGATVRIASSEKSQAIRFGIRTNTATRHQDTDEVYKNDNVSDISVITIPQVALNLYPNVAIQDNKYAKKTVINSVSKATYNYSDIAVAQSIKTGAEDMQIVSVLCIEFNDGTETVYSEPISRSYNSVLNAAYPQYVSGNNETVATIVTNNEVDDSSITNDLSYKIGDDIVFTGNIKGAYKVEWVLSKDDASANLIGDEAIVNKSLMDGSAMGPQYDFNYFFNNSAVKSGLQQGGTFKVTTQMKSAGMVRLTCIVYDYTGKRVTMIEMSVAVDVDNIGDQAPEPTSYVDKNGTTVNKTVKEFYNEIKADWNANQIAALSNSVNSEAFKEFWAAKAENVNFDDGVVKLEYVANMSNENYAVYDFKLATDSTVGVESTGDDGYFHYAEYNNRPASGVITIPKNAADNSLSVYSTYQGYGNGTASKGWENKTQMFLALNSHGFKNFQDTSYYDNIQKASPYTSSDGKYGTKSFHFDEATLTDPTQSYYYGMLKRDYCALQFVKLLPEYNKTAGRNITTEGGSMGGWQSVVMAVLEDNTEKCNPAICWMATVGGKENGKIPSTFMVDGSTAHMYFGTTYAAKLLNKDIVLTMNGGLGDYTAPPAGLIAVYNNAPCTVKTLTLTQQRGHGGTNSSLNFNVTLSQGK